MSNGYKYRGTKAYEGFRPNVYIDSEGNKTIGIGELWKKGMPTTVTKAEATKRFNRKKAQHVASFYERNPALANAPANVKTVMEDNAYNMGPAYLDKFPKMKTALYMGNYKEAGNQLMDSEYARQVGQRAFDNAAYMANGANAAPTVFNKSIHGIKGNYPDLGSTANPSAPMSDATMALIQQAREVEAAKQLAQADKMQKINSMSPGVGGLVVGQDPITIDRGEAVVSEGLGNGFGNFANSFAAPDVNGIPAAVLGTMGRAVDNNGMQYGGSL